MSQLAVKDINAVPAGAARITPYFWHLAAGLLLLRLIIDSKCNLVPDEAFYWTWTRHLSTGYFDHPPMIAWIIWLSTRVFGNTEVGVRLPASVMSIASLAVLFVIGKQILHDSRALGFIVLMWAAGPLLPVIGTIITPDAPATFFSVCALACAVKIAARDDLPEDADPATGASELKLWLAFGLLCGLAFLSKYTTVLVPAGAGLAFLLSRRGIRHFARPGIYLAALISLLVFSPCIYWNYTHHWASFLFQINHGAGGGLTEGVTGTFRQMIARLSGLGQFVGGQALVWTPILFGMGLLLLVSNWGVVLRDFWVRRIPLFIPSVLNDPSVKFGKLKRLSQVDWLLLWSATLPLIFFGFMSMRSHGEINWPAFAYFPLSLLIARFLSENWTGVRVQWARIGCQVALAFTIVIHLVAVPRVQQWLLGHHVHVTHQVTDLWGWDQFGNKLRMETIGLPVVCNRHQDAGEAAFYMPGQPDVWCDGVGSRTTAFDFFDQGKPDYDHIPNVAFVGGHWELFKKKHDYPLTKEVTEDIMPGLGKNRSHLVTVVGR